MMSTLSRLDIIDTVDRDIFWKLLVIEIVSNMEYKIDRRAVSFKQLIYNEVSSENS